MIKVYTAEWCSGCKVVKPLLDQSGLEIEYLDVDKGHKDGLINLGVRSIPCLIDEQGKVHVGSDQIIIFLKGC